MQNNILIGKKQTKVDILLKLYKTMVILVLLCGYKSWVVQTGWEYKQQKRNLMKAQSLG